MGCNFIALLSVAVNLYTWFAPWLIILKNTCLALGTKSENFNVHLAISINSDRSYP